MWQQPGDVGHCCLFAMDNAETITDEDIRECSEFGRHCGAFLNHLRLIPRIKPDVLKQGHFTVLQCRDRGLRRGPGNVRREGDRLPQQLGETGGDWSK